MGDPTVYLTPPSAPDDSMANGFMNPTDVFNYVSPTAWICTAIEEISGVDIIGKITDFLAGDWEAIWKFGDAMANMAQFMQELGIEIQQGILTLDESWDGNASDAAVMYFSHL